MERAELGAGIKRGVGQGPSRELSVPSCQENGRGGGQCTGFCLGHQAVVLHISR